MDPLEPERARESILFVYDGVEDCGRFTLTASYTDCCVDRASRLDWISSRQSTCVNESICCMKLSEM